MKCIPAFVSLVFPILLAAAVAPGEEPGAAPAEPPTAAASRFFDHPVDYWGSGEAALPGRDPAGRTGVREIQSPKSKPSHEWGERIRMPDGTLAFQELPEPLVLVLEDPSSENIRAYFEWRDRRMQKILVAADRMQAYRDEHPPADRTPPPVAPAASQTRTDLPAALGLDGPVSEAPSAGPGDPASEPIRMIYFRRTGCSHCEGQDMILAAWLRDKPGLALETIEWGSKPDLWTAYRVRGTPSIAFERPGARRFLEGLTGPAALDRALAQVRSAVPSDRVRRGAGGP